MSKMMRSLLNRTTLLCHAISAMAGLLALAVVLCSFSLAQSGRFDAAGEREIVALINQERTSRGLQPLTVDGRLTSAARQHTGLMLRYRTLSHQFDGEERLSIRFAGQEIRSDQQAENVAYAGDVAEAHRTLMHSPGHRANILNPNYNAVGVGIAWLGSQIYVTEDFAHKLTDYSPYEADSALEQAIARYRKSRGLPVPSRRRQSNLRQIACDMARNDALDNSASRKVPGARAVASWTATEIETLPSNAKGLLSQPLDSGYSLGDCYAPSISYPGGIYWVVMVVY